MTILITGATGLIGQNLVKTLLKHSSTNETQIKIRLFIRKRTGSPSRENFIQWASTKGIEIIWGNLKSTPDVLRFTEVSDPECSVLIHCGAIFNFYQPYPLLYDTNVVGTTRILHGFHVNRIKKLVLVSSIAVYGVLHHSNGHGVTEEQPIDCKQRRSYELTKSLSEQYVWNYSKINPDRLITLLRPSGVVGGQGVTSDIFARMFFGRYVLLPGGGAEKISLVDVQDVVKALIHFSNFHIGNGEAFNLVSFTPTLREFIVELGHVLNRQEIKILSIPLGLFKPLFYLSKLIRTFKKPKENSLFLPILFEKLGQGVWIDNSKILAHGFYPESTLSESMSNFHQFLVKNPWYAEEKFSIAL
ncbi:MAG: NAD-dependent epimerase/dehydratase family protein [Candidatus Hodarchaeales archaeon]|jgi:nucleoside-diphosphate-sugar epimerase